MVTSSGESSSSARSKPLGRRGQALALKLADLASAGLFRPALFFGGGARRGSVRIRPRSLRSATPLSDGRGYRPQRLVAVGVSRWSGESGFRADSPRMRGTVRASVAAPFAVVAVVGLVVERFVPVAGVELHQGPVRRSDSRSPLRVQLPMSRQKPVSDRFSLS